MFNKISLPSQSFKGQIKCSFEPDDRSLQDVMCAFKFDAAKMPKDDILIINEKFDQSNKLEAELAYKPGINSKNKGLKKFSISFLENSYDDLITVSNNLADEVNKPKPSINNFIVNCKDCLLKSINSKFTYGKSQIALDEVDHVELKA